MKNRMPFHYCASCGGSLDTGWECDACGRDWIRYAVSWPQRLRAKFVFWWRG